MAAFKMIAASWAVHSIVLDIYDVAFSLAATILNSPVATELLS